MPEQLTCQPHGRRVDDRHHFLDVVDDHPIEEPLVPVVERSQVDIFVEVGRLSAEVLQDLLNLLVLSEDPWWDESSQLQSVSLLLGEGRTLVERWDRSAIGSRSECAVACSSPHSRFFRLSRRVDRPRFAIPVSGRR